MRRGKNDSPPRVLIVGPGRAVRGGITSVLLDYQKNDLWKRYSCRWLETYNDRGPLCKIASFVTSFAKAIWLIPGSDIVHIHAAHNTSFYRKTVFFLMARLTRRKTILHLHAPYPDDFRKRPLDVVSRWVFSRADRVVALSERWAKVVREVAPKARVAVVANPGPAPQLDALPAGEREPIILFAGKLEQRKGYGDLLRAMPHILARVPQARLLFAGHGEIEAAEQLARELGVSDRVEFMGWVRGDAKDSLFRQARVFCLPSYGEGVPMALLEAMASGTPSVVTPVGGIPDLIVHENNGVLVQSGHSEQICEAVVSLLTDDVLANKVAAGALLTVSQKHGPDVVSKQISAVYDAVSATRDVKKQREMARMKSVASPKCGRERILHPDRVAAMKD